MNRFWAALVPLLFLLALTGCSGSSPAETGAQTSTPAAQPSAEPPAPPPPPPAPPVAEPPLPALTVLAGEPLDYFPSGMEQNPEVEVFSNVCRAGVTSQPTLAVEVRGAEWRAHPVNPEFWVPVVTVTVCNQGSEQLKQRYLRLQVVQGDRAFNAGSVRFERLLPGEGVGPLRLYAWEGIPERAGQLWAADGTRWPSWTLQLWDEDQFVARVEIERRLSGSDLSAGEGQPAPWPDPPSLEVLEALGRGKRTFRDAKGEATIFLYSAKARYLINTSPYCGAIKGDIEAAAEDWAFYLSRAGAPPARLAEVGEFWFTGNRKMTATTVPALEMTVLALGTYASCAVPNVHDLYAFDHQRGEIFRPQMRFRDGHDGPARVASFAFTPEGKLTSHYYSNAEDIGWHTNTYGWDPVQRMWIFEQHTKE